MQPLMSHTQPGTLISAQAPVQPMAELQLWQRVCALPFCRASQTGAKLDIKACEAGSQRIILNARLSYDQRSSFGRQLLFARHITGTALLFQGRHIARDRLAGSRPGTLADRSFQTATPDDRGHCCRNRPPFCNEYSGPRKFIIFLDPLSGLAILDRLYLRRNDPNALCHTLL